MEYTTRGVCGQEGCRERRYYLDNGLWFCRRGHQQEGRQVEAEHEDFGTQGKTNRIKKAVAEKSHKTYRGRQAYSLFLQVYQLILWKQSHALVQGRGFPAAFENVVRDLWALRLETYSDKIDDSGDGNDEPEFFSSQPATNLDEPEVYKTRNQWPRLIDTVALCYLATLLMRLPVSVADYYRMTIRGDIPYIRVIKSIPREMRDKLPQEYLALIETTRLIEVEHLHKAVSELLLLYHHRFGVQFPPLNSPALLYRSIRRLALPIETYPSVNRLQALLDFNFEYHTNTAGRKGPLHLPEVQLATLIVISVKLLFPFDDIERHPVSAKDPTTQAIDWERWAQAQRYFDSRETSNGKIGKGNEILVKESDVFSMEATQLDEYMDWYEKSWLDISKASTPLADLFPTGPMVTEPQSTTTNRAQEETDEEATSSMLQTVTSQLQPRKVISKQSDLDIPRPGTSYQRYRSESDLPDAARPFFEVAAKVAGVSLATLVRAVFQAETRITRWLEDQRRIEFHGEPMDTQATRENSTEFEGFDGFEEMEELMSYI